MSNKNAVILAAGKGTRMKSKLPKILHPVCEKPMVQHIVDQVTDLSFQNVVTVVGHDADRVREEIRGDIDFVTQEEQLGTAHAVQQASPLLSDKKGTTVVLCGDTPLISGDTISELVEQHETSGAAATVLTALADDPSGYGRVIRDKEGHVNKIVEHKDADESELAVKEINTGIYCFDNELLFSCLKQVNNDNVQGEYYLPDVIGILQEQQKTIAAAQAPTFDETIGVNDRVALSRAEQLMRQRINEFHLRQGVAIIDPAHTYISLEAVIGSDTVIYPGTVIKGKVTIGDDCVIGPNSEIESADIGEGTTIKHSVVTDSTVGEKVTIGPFAHIRPDSTIGDQVKVGNFVEVKKTKMDTGSKASHLSYIGDADIGKNVNLGCGSITVNYDGFNKHLTKVEDGAFIGCNVNLVAPVTVGKGAFVAAGSTITDDVETEALAIARSRQTNKENYVQKINPKKK